MKASYTEQSRALNKGPQPSLSTFARSLPSPYRIFPLQFAQHIPSRLLTLNSPPKSAVRKTSYPSSNLPMNPFILLAASILGNFLTLTLLRDPSATAFWHKIAFPNAIGPPGERLGIPIPVHVPGLDPIVSCMRADRGSIETCLPGFWRRMEDVVGERVDAVMKGVAEGRWDGSSVRVESGGKVGDGFVPGRAGNETEIPAMQQLRSGHERADSKRWDSTSTLLSTFLYALSWLPGLFFLIRYLVGISNAVKQLGKRLDYQTKVTEDRTEILAVSERLMSGLTWPEPGKTSDQHGLD